MKVTLLGTGCPAAHPARGGAAALVEAEGARVLVDCGAGVTPRLAQAGCPGARLDALLLTHLHSDHLVDLYQLIVSSWHQGRDRPWRIFCAEGMRGFVEGTMALWAEERARRVAWEKRPSAVGLGVEIEEIGGGARLGFGGLGVTVVEVDHAPVTPALGFVFDAGGERAVLSGDTRVSPPLIEAGRGADLLVHEVYIHREMTPVPGVRGAETIAATADYHTLSTQVGGVAAAMGAKALALTHFVPPEFDRAALLAEVARSYAGPVFVGEDLMGFDLTSGDVSWDRFRARLL